MKAQTAREQIALIREATIPMLEAATPLILIGGGSVMAISTMLVGTYIGNSAAALDGEVAQRRYEHSDKILGFGQIIATGLIGAGTAMLRFDGDRRRESTFIRYSGSPGTSKLHDERRPPPPPMPPATPRGSQMMTDPELRSSDDQAYATPGQEYSPSMISLEARKLAAQSEAAILRARNQNL